MDFRAYDWLRLLSIGSWFGLPFFGVWSVSLAVVPLDVDCSRCRSHYMMVSVDGRAVSFAVTTIALVSSCLRLVGCRLLLLPFALHDG